MRIYPLFHLKYALYVPKSHISLDHLVLLRRSLFPHGFLPYLDELCMTRDDTGKLDSITERPDLPIDEVIGELLEALANHDEAVLQASPGAGKTTRVPLSLLKEPWLKGQRILMLEPRRFIVTILVFSLSAFRCKPHRPLPASRFPKHRACTF